MEIPEYPHSSEWWRRNGGEKYMQILNKYGDAHPKIGAYKLYKYLEDFFKPKYTVIDLGCGVGNFSRHIECKSICCVDIWEDYLKEVEDFATEILRINIIHILNSRPPKSYDVVLMTDVIEHLTEVEGFKLLDDMVELARKVVVVYTPANWDENEQSNEEVWSYGNPYQKHQSLWTEDGFHSKGYETKKYFREGIIAWKYIEVNE